MTNKKFYGEVIEEGSIWCGTITNNRWLAKEIDKRLFGEER